MKPLRMFWTVMLVILTAASLVIASDYKLERPVFSGGGGALQGTDYHMRTVVVGQNMPTAQLSNNTFSTQANSGYVLMLAPNNAPKFKSNKDYYVADDLWVNPHEFNGASIANVLEQMKNDYSDIDHEIYSDQKFGLAVTGVNNAQGQWQYSTDNGAAWTDIDDVSDTSALLLADDEQTRLRFLPNMDYMGGFPGEINFRIWDQYRGKTGDTNIDLTDASWVYTVNKIENTGILLGNVMAVPMAVPSMNEWGIMFFLGILLYSSLRMIYRQRSHVKLVFTSSR